MPGVYMYLHVHMLKNCFCFVFLFLFFLRVKNNNKNKRWYWKLKTLAVKTWGPLEGTVPKAEQQVDDHIGTLRYSKVNNVAVKIPRTMKRGPSPV